MLFLSGLLFGEAIEAAAGVLTDDEAAAAPFEMPNNRLVALGAAAEQAQSEQMVEAVSVELFERVHDALLAMSPEAITAARREIWNVLADCESGDWVRGVPKPGSHRWDSTAGYFEGGLQFAPPTWDGFRDPDMPASAYDATPVQQIVVAERVLERQGWKAWPVCSRKVGYR
ncbi:MAG: hypothetical protein ACI867_000668 [Glaciecola sp.]|jgi:hypothetical protein